MVLANPRHNFVRPANHKLISHFAESKALQAKSHHLIPGGAHTYAKGDDQYPELAPGFLVKGSGCRVWDVDGNEYIEYGMGLRAVTLGHAYAPVVQAATRQMHLGSNFTRPSPIELECAEQLLSCLPAAEMVKFAKHGSDATTAAVKLARACTERDYVAVCVDQPFFSADDWFMSRTPMAAGVPAGIRGLTLGFRYNDVASVQALFEQYPGQISCLIMEAETTEPPRNDFLLQVQQMCHAQGALFILDEIITGFRWQQGSAQVRYQLTPDLSTFGKALSNGFSVSALAGKRQWMERGGLDHNHDRVFLLSATHGAETHSLAAALATMQIYRQEPVIEHLYRQGERLRQGINQAIAAYNLQEAVQVLGQPCNLVYVTRDAEGERSQAFRTLLLQETIRRGVLMPSLVVSYSHGDADIDYTIDAIAGALEVYRAALENGIHHYLVGPSVKPVFRQRN
jgi:glutamate-1-semialdehyde 2,1-aminomutase